MIPYGRQTIDDDDVAAVVAVLRSDRLTQGPRIEAFERAVADRVGAHHAVAFSSGTAALHGAAVAAGLGPGDVVATSPLTFMASANCARYVGAEVRLIDLEPSTWNLDPAAVDADVDAVVAVHYAGLPVDLRRLGHRPRIVIEDAAHALGAETPDGPVGNCARSDLCCFSFHPVKPVTTAEGGVVTTNDDELADRMRRFRTHGMERTDGAPGWHYEIGDLGFNYRLSDLHAALGVAQMHKLDGFVERRNELADRYRTMLADLDVGLPPAAPVGWRHGYHLFPVLVERRHAVYDALQAAGVGVQVHYVPVHHHPISADLGVRPGDLPVCDHVYDRILSLPLHPRLTIAEQDRVVDELRRAL